VAPELIFPRVRSFRINSAHLRTSALFPLDSGTMYDTFVLATICQLAITNPGVGKVERRRFAFLTCLDDWPVVDSRAWSFAASAWDAGTLTRVPQRHDR